MTTNYGTGVLTFGGISLVGVGVGGRVTPRYGGSLLALVGADTPVGYNSGGGTMLLDYANDKAYFYELTPTTGASGIKKLTISNTGNEDAQATQVAIFGDAGGGTPNHSWNTDGICVHPMGKIFCSVDFANSTPIAMIDTAALTLTAVVGISSSSLNQSTNNDSGQKRFVTSFQMLPLQTAGGNFIVSRGIRGGGIENEVGVFAVDGGTISVSYAADIIEAVARLGPGRSGSDVFASTFYVLGDLFNRASGDPTPVQVYRYIVDGTGNVLPKALFTVAPATVDATWTNFTTISSPGYDLADDCILAFFSTLDAVTHKDYLVKLNPVTGAIVWKLAVSNALALRLDLSQSNINGTLGYHTTGSPSTVTLIDLSNGTTTTQNWNAGFSTISPQMWDYKTGSVTGGMAYSQGAGPIPTYLGAYLAGHSNVIPTNRWGRIFTGAPYSDQKDSSGSAGSAPQRAWTYTLDGHTFYVLDLGAEGTFVYDIVTQHWAKFITTSTAPLWNMSVGTMWNDRVVAGDRTTGDVWELSPNAQLDNGTANITRVVSGLAVRRSNDFVSIGTLQIAASSGVLSGTATQSISLRFSDDLGNTWVGPFDITLTPADFSQNIEFIGLGGFAAPGRLFEIKDVGGLVRIDACTVTPDLEPDDGQQPG